jgi:hypothetical protein
MDALCNLRRRNKKRVPPHAHRIEIRLAQDVDPVREQTLES